MLLPVWFPVWLQNSSDFLQTQPELSISHPEGDDELDFSHNSDSAESWKRTRLLGWWGGGGAAPLSLGKNIHRLSFPRGFAAWSDEMRHSHHPDRSAACGSAQLRTASWLLNLSHPPALSWQSYVTSRSQCLSSTPPHTHTYIHTHTHTHPPFLSNFLHSSFVSTPAQSIPHINPHGHDNPHYVFMSCSLLSLPVSLSLPRSYAPSFVLFAPIARKI